MAPKKATKGQEAEHLPLLLLFDGHALVHRAYHALPPLTISRTGEPIAAVYGFTSMLLKALAELKPTHAAVAFDKAGPTFRHLEYAAYKIQRPSAPEELRQQFQRVRQVVTALALPIYEIDGYEADDVLGTLARRAEAEGLDTVIITGDADTMQLVSPHVRILIYRGRLGDVFLFDEKGVRERYGVSPQQIADFKGLKGDPSDNIPGVPGIGDKTAAKLLQEFGSLEGIYAHVESVNPPKLRELLRQYEAQARQSKHLATIVTQVPLALNLPASRWGPYRREEVVALFRELEFRSLLSKLPWDPSGQEGTRQQLQLLPHTERPAGVVAAAPAGTYQAVTTPETLGELLERLSRGPSFAVDVETTGLDPMRARLVGIAVALQPGEASYIPVGHLGDPQLSLELVADRLRPLLKDPTVAKVAHNGNYDMTVLAEHGLPLENLGCDTMIAAYLLGEKALGLKDLAFSRLGVEMTPIAALIGSGATQRSMAQVPIAEATAYACADVDMTLRLREVLEGELRERRLWSLYTEVELPLVAVLVQMQRHGIALDTSRLREMGQQLGQQMTELEQAIYHQVGHRFNINSPQQLGEVLFKELHLPSAKRTKTGYSTDAAVLEELRSVHPIIELILEYRQISKLKSTYVDALPALIHPRTGRLHTSFNQTVAATGRLSSSDPNLQNIPIRTELGRRVRQAFIAANADDPSQPWCLLGADYSQIELRILAHVAQDPGLLAAFAAEEDIHAATAAEVFRISREAVTPEHRRVAKTVNFGVIYGLSEFGLSQSTGLSREEASQFIQGYFARYPKVQDYLNRTKEQARELGYVETILGRRRYIPELHSANAQVRAAAERMAVNMPIQGTAADIIKIAMIRLQEAMDRAGSKSRMLLQVHDELIFEVPQGEMATMKALIREIMPGALSLSVPLRVELKVGPNWGELE